jgi:hypothetical protein
MPTLSALCRGLLLLCAVSLLSLPVLCAQARREGSRRVERRDDDFWRHGRRRRHGSIGGAYKRAGESAAHGTAGFARHLARGRPVRATRRLGRGAGGFGKHTGIGTARVGAKVGRGVKRVFTR